MRYLSGIFKNKVNLIAKSTDLVLLAFLILVLNVSLVVKLIAIIFIYSLRFNLKFDFKNKRIPLFYISILILIPFQLLFNYSIWQLNYFIVVILGVLFWAISFLISHQLKLAIEKNGVSKINHAFTAFFIINIIVSFTNIILIILELKTNPYTFEGLGLKYHVSTGDWIKGISFDFSLTNTLISIFGIIYFLHKNKIILSFLCLFVVLLATSNASVIILLAALILITIIHKNQYYKSVSIFFVGLIIVFFVKITPQNIEYATDKKLVSNNVKQNNDKPTPKELLKAATLKNYSEKFSAKKSADNIKTNLIASTKNESIKEVKKSVESDTLKKQLNELNSKREKLITATNEIYGDTVLSLPYHQYPGKLISLIETIKYNLSSIKHFFIGSGIGNFSSKTAFKASSINVFGNYPQKFKYISNDFKENHLKIHCYYFLQPPAKHSMTNNPFSTYNQLLGEYGLIGLFLFLIFYIGFFIKNYKLLTYGKIILPLLMVFLAFDFWFEHLSIIIIFELLMFLDIAEQKEKLNPPLNPIPKIK